MADGYLDGMDDDKYILEHSKSGRAACMQSSCRRNEVMIESKEWRFASVATTGNYTRTFYKHLRCVTATQLSNVQDTYGSLDAFVADQQARGRIPTREAPVVLQALVALSMSDYATFQAIDAELMEMGGYTHADAEGGAGPAKPKAGKKKKKKQRDDESEEDEEDYKPRAKKSKKKAKKPAAAAAEDGEGSVSTAATHEEPARKKKTRAKRTTEVAAEDIPEEERKTPLLEQPPAVEGKRKRKEAKAYDPSDAPIRQPPQLKTKLTPLETAVVDAVRALGFASSEDVHTHLSTGPNASKAGSVTAALSRCVKKGHVTLNAQGLFAVSSTAPPTDDTTEADTSEHTATMAQHTPGHTDNAPAHASHNLHVIIPPSPLPLPNTSSPPFSPSTSSPTHLLPLPPFPAMFPTHTHPDTHTTYPTYTQNTYTTGGTHAFSAFAGGGDVLDPLNLLGGSTGAAAGSNNNSNNGGSSSNRSTTTQRGGRRKGKGRGPALVDGGRLQRALEQRHFCVNGSIGGAVDRPVGTFNVLSHSGSLYTVTFSVAAVRGELRVNSKCSCPDSSFRGGSNVCKHGIFVACRVLGLQAFLEEDQALPVEAFQQALNSPRLAHIRTQPPPPSAPTPTPPPAQLKPQSHIETDDDCPICFEALVAEGSQEPLVYCKLCGRSEHKACWKQWVAAKHGELSCTLCRGVGYVVDGVVV